MGIHIKIFNSQQWSVAKSALIAAGLLKGTPDKVSNTQDFVNQLESAFPAVYQNIIDVINIYRSKTMSGGDKAVAVAREVLETAPVVLKEIPGIKDAMTAAVTSVFADQVSAFGAATLKSIFKK